MAFVEVAEVLIYFNDKRWARNHPDLYASLSDNGFPSRDDRAGRVDSPSYARPCAHAYHRDRIP